MKNTLSVVEILNIFLLLLLTEVYSNSTFLFTAKWMSQQKLSILDHAGITVEWI